MKILFSLLAFCLFASCVHSQEAVDTERDRGQVRVPPSQFFLKTFVKSQCWTVLATSNWNYTTLKQRGGYDERSICTKHRV